MVGLKPMSSLQIKLQLVEEISVEASKRKRRKFPGWTPSEPSNLDRSHLCQKAATHQKASLIYISSARESDPKSEVKRTC